MSIHILSNSEFPILDLTSVIQTLEGFQDFEPQIKATVIALYASELAITNGWRQETAELHLYKIEFHAGLEVTRWN